MRRTTTSLLALAFAACFSAASQTVPAQMFECDSAQQCGQGGFGAWTLQGNHGQAIWSYGAVAVLTVTKFDGTNIVIHREDPVGSYSSRFVDRKVRPDGLFVADYIGVIHNNRIDGKVSWGGGPPSGSWYAIIPARNCTQAAECPAKLNAILELGILATNAKQYEPALFCFRIGAANGNPDSQGVVGRMTLEGYGTASDPKAAVPFLIEGAEHGSYDGQIGLSALYRIGGPGIPVDPEKAKFWSDKAAETHLQLQAETREKIQQKQLLRGMFESVFWGGSDSQGVDAAQQAEMDYIHARQEHDIHNASLGYDSAGQPQ
jgi:hypothetical protein